MAKKIVTVPCKKCNGAMYLGKGGKKPCPKCIDPNTGKPTGQFTKEIDSSSTSL